MLHVTLNFELWPLFRIVARVRKESMCTWESISSTQEGQLKSPLSVVELQSDSSTLSLFPALWAESMELSSQTPRQRLWRKCKFNISGALWTLHFGLSISVLSPPLLSPQLLSGGLKTWKWGRIWAGACVQPNQRCPEEIQDKGTGEEGDGGGWVWYPFHTGLIPRPQQCLLLAVWNLRFKIVCKFYTVSHQCCWGLQNRAVLYRHWTVDTWCHVSVHIWWLYICMQGYIEQDALVLNTSKGNPRLRDLYMRPVIGSRRIQVIELI